MLVCCHNNREAFRGSAVPGDDLPMRLIRDNLIVSEELGSIPPETWTVPLQQDVSNEL